MSIVVNNLSKLNFKQNQTKTVPRKIDISSNDTFTRTIKPNNISFTSFDYEKYVSPEDKKEIEAKPELTASEVKYIFMQAQTPEEGIKETCKKFDKETAQMAKRLESLSSVTNKYADTFNNKVVKLKGKPEKVIEQELYDSMTDLLLLKGYYKENLYKRIENYSDTKQAITENMKNSVSTYESSKPEDIITYTKVAFETEQSIDFTFAEFLDSTYSKAYAFDIICEKMGDSDIILKIRNGTFEPLPIIDNSKDSFIKRKNLSETEQEEFLANKR